MEANAPCPFQWFMDNFFRAGQYDVEALKHDIVHLAQQIGVPYDSASISQCVDAFKTEFSTGSVQLRSTSKLKGNSVCYRFELPTLTPSPESVADMAFQAGLLTEEKYRSPQIVFVNQFDRRFGQSPADGKGVFWRAADFDTTEGFAKMWSCSSATLRDCLTVECCPEAAIRRVASLLPQGLDSKVALIGIDVNKGTCNLYFNANRDFEVVRETVEKCGLKPTKEELESLLHLEKHAGVKFPFGFTVDWSSDKILGFFTYLSGFLRDHPPPCASERTKELLNMEFTSVLEEKNKPVWILGLKISPEGSYQAVDYDWNNTVLFVTVGRILFTNR